MQALSIGTIDQMADALLASGNAVQDGDAIVINSSEIGIDKVLGSGRVTRKMNISAKSFSAQAVAKIEAQGGQALIT
jgi:large subunit ribosomal protein L15